VAERYLGLYAEAWRREDDRRDAPPRGRGRRFRSEYDYAVFEYRRSAKVIQASSARG
jgi:hypothetical protein